MLRAEMEAIGRLAGEALAVSGGLIEQTHTGVAQRVFGSAPSFTPARALHDGISRAVYTGVRGGLRGVAVAAGTVAGRRAPTGGEPLSAHPRAALVLGALNGVWGDRIVQRTPELAFTMEVRRHGVAVPPNPEAVRAAFPDASSRLAVFVHGLCETDDAWRLYTRAAEPRTYGERLQDDLAYTPIHVRYNTGLRVSDNGRALAALLAGLTRAWPVGVQEIVLVGHSMGGLVARSACHYGEQAGMRFADQIRHVFCLGTPHLGADLEKGANALACALAKLPETRALGQLLNARSAGIKDLRYGACVEEDWTGIDPDEFLRDRCREVPFMPGAAYYFIGATLAPAPLGRLIGDLLVRSPSASGRGTGRGRRIPFEVDNGTELAGINHFQLLNHPAVYRQLHLWITRAPRRPLAALPPGGRAQALLAE